MKNLKETVRLVSVIAILLLVLCGTILLLSGCTEASIVNYNLSKEADNFNILRRLTVMNARTDTVMLELTGRFSLSNNAENELVVTCEYDKGVYKKNYIYLTDNVLYVIEDLSGAEVSPYQYELTFLPETVPMVDYKVEWEEAE